MYELNPEAKRLRNAIDLLRRNNNGDIEDAAKLIEDVASELRDHDCDDFVSECKECERLEGQLRDVSYDVRECLELGLPALVEKYGLSSYEVRRAQEVIDGQA